MQQYQVKMNSDTSKYLLQQLIEMNNSLEDTEMIIDALFQNRHQFTIQDIQQDFINQRSDQQIDLSQLIIFKQFQIKEENNQQSLIQKSIKYLKDIYRNLTQQEILRYLQQQSGLDLQGLLQNQMMNNIKIDDLFKISSAEAAKLQHFRPFFFLCVFKTRNQFVDEQNKTRDYKIEYNYSFCQISYNQPALICAYCDDEYLYHIINISNPIRKISSQQTLSYYINDTTSQKTSFITVYNINTPQKLSRVKQFLNIYHCQLVIFMGDFLINKNLNILDEQSDTSREIQRLLWNKQYILNKLADEIEEYGTVIKFIISKEGNILPNNFAEKISISQEFESTPLQFQFGNTNVLINDIDTFFQTQQNILSLEQYNQQTDYNIDQFIQDQQQPIPNFIYKTEQGEQQIENISSQVTESSKQLYLYYQQCLCSPIANFLLTQITNQLFIKEDINLYITSQDIDKFNMNILGVQCCNIVDGITLFYGLNKQVGAIYFD